MSVKLDNFVSVELSKRNVIPSGTEFDTAVFVADLTPDAATATEQRVTLHGYYSKNGSGNGSGNTKENSRAYSVLEDKPIYQYVKIFFDNGGKYLHVVKDVDMDENSASKLKATYAVNVYEGGASDSKTETIDLPLNEFIFFKDKDTTVTKYNNTDLDGVYQKIWIDSTMLTNVAAGDKQSGVVYKYTANFDSTTTPASITTDYLVASTAAYYTKIRLNNANSIKDYAFTAETMYMSNNVAVEATDSNATVSDCITNGTVNVNTYLAGAYRNIGGNDSTGEELTNVVMRIILQQTVMSRLVALLVTKIKLNPTGISSVKAVLANELDRYVNNGYIDATKVWQEDDLYIDNELVASQGLPLSNGYAIHVSPITQTNISDHTIPNIHILYGDAIGVRKIVICGEVF